MQKYHIHLNTIIDYSVYLDYNYYIDGLVQDCSNSIENALLELWLSARLQ